MRNPVQAGRRAFFSNLPLGFNGGVLPPEDVGEGLVAA